MRRSRSSERSILAFLLFLIMCFFYNKFLQRRVVWDGYFLFHHLYQSFAEYICIVFSWFWFSLHCFGINSKVSEQASLMTSFLCYPCTMIASDESFGESSVWDASSSLLLCHFPPLFSSYLFQSAFSYELFIFWINDATNKLRYLSATPQKGLKINVIDWDPIAFVCLFVLVPLIL